MDIKNDGYLEKIEIRTAMAKAGVFFTDDEFDYYFDGIDENHDGQLDMKEVLEWFK